MIDIKFSKEVSNKYFFDMMHFIIGIGVVLVTVSAVAWRVTSRENCSSFFGFTGISSRIPPARPIHPYAAMIYPEFQFRTPPPSYQVTF